MRINIRDKAGDTIFGVTVDPAKPPTVVKPADEPGPTVSLDWDRALDDQRQLRRCPVCGCPDLFARKQLPQLTAFVVLILAAVAAMVLFGLQMVELAIGVLVLLVVIDVGIFLFAKRVLECYRCRSAFRDMPIRRRHPRYDAALAEKYRREAAQAPAQHHGAAKS